MKHLTIIIALLTLCIWDANAQMCEIVGSDDTVAVNGYTWNEGDSSVLVTVSNDSSNTAANVEVKVTVSYKWENKDGYNQRKSIIKHSFSGVGLSSPGCSSVIKVPIDTMKSETNTGYYKPYSVVVESVSGKKCS